MKNKKYILIFVFLFIIILLVGWYTINKLKKEQETSNIQEEYIPQEEILEDQTRDTIVTVYFPNKETGKIMPEAKVVDVREIVNNPYQKLMELLIAGPTNDKLEKIIPENTIILGITLENECITINLSSDILNYNKEKENTKENLIKSIVNTFTELTEVSKVKIIVEGQENENFNETYERINN